MAKLFWQSLLAVPAALGAAVAVSGSAIAAEAATPLVSDFDQDSVQLAQITSVSELTDVLPSDWAFQALQSLVENYGCIQGYPDRTFRGQRSLTRFEFAAGLNSCLDVIATLIAQSGIDPDDLATIRRLQEEFQAELATLRGRVDALEAETATLRAQQFSTTTKLVGQADFHLVTPIDIVTGEASTSVAARARLNFDSSFTGNDRLRIRLQSARGNAISGDGFSDGLLGGLANASSSDAGNEDNTDYNVAVDDFYYQFPVGSRITVTASARGLQGDDWVTSTIVPFDGPSVADAGGPQFYDAGGSTTAGPGVGLSFALTDSIVFDAGYTSGEGGFTPSVGIFAANSQSYIGQLSFITDGFLDAGIAYIHSDRSDRFNGVAGATDTYAGLLNLDFGRFFVAGHGAYTTYNGGNDFSWTAGVGLNDFLAEGAQLGVYGGQLPQLLGTTNNPTLIEGYYEIPFNQFLTITPAVIYGDINTNLAGNDDIGLWGALRATFRF
ncbi:MULTISPECIES: iron uptake porin [Cyanophyceae]|uniref:Iron uptake porin n=1 Tax=Leptolyngbya subtilissima DQ-A4 TaxID=2933933 RepID=A0ABV0K5X7_9CYAN|nr:iron uptake porin [Nodosilinea sp. FACHB-141]MBD2112861.1 carbohydrate porin [Nodosilinea sp. FACHB-141]